MAFNPVVMTNYNSNNPMIIICKQQYDRITDAIQLYGKTQIQCFIPMIINLILSIVLEVLSIVYIGKFPIVNTIVLSVIVIFGVLWAKYLTRSFKLYMSNHPLMKSFNELSQLEMSEIANIGISNEDILKALHGLYQLYGELISEIRYTRAITYLVDGLTMAYLALFYVMLIFGKVVI